jgi:RNA-directed DNA polymerase
MTKAPIGLQDLRRSLHVKAKAEPAWRFWGLYVHVCKMETLQTAYEWRRVIRGLREMMGAPSKPLSKAGGRVSPADTG